MSCSHPHVWAYEGHVWCFVCKGLVSRSGEAECRELRARLDHEFLKANAAAAYAKSYANSWQLAINHERARGERNATDARKRALSLLDKERIEWKDEKTRMEARQRAEIERITEDAEAKLACIRREVTRITGERDRLIQEKKKSRPGFASIGVGAGDVRYGEDDVERENAEFGQRTQVLGAGRLLLVELFVGLFVGLFVLL